MKHLLQKVVGSFLDYCGFLPMEDYRFVQEARWRAEQRAERLEKEQFELLDNIYATRYKGFEQIFEDPNAKFEYFEIVLQEIDIAYRVRLPHWQVAATFDPTEEMEQVKSAAIYHLGHAFMDKLMKVFYKL